MTKSNLKIYRKHAGSIFGLLGDDENALTFSLGYIFSIRNDVLISFLKEIGILPSQKGKSYKKVFSDYMIHLQQYNDDKSGIKDIVIEDLKSKKIKIIIEAKTDDTLPTIKQLIKYTSGQINSDLQTFDERWIIVLTRKGVPLTLQTQLEQQFITSNIKILFVTWGIVLKIMHKFSFTNINSYEDRIIQELQKFLNMDYKIKYFEHEVITVKVKKNNGYYGSICNREGIGYYFNGSRKDFVFPSCLFFLASYGPAKSSSLNADFLRRIISYDTLSGQSIQASGNLEMIQAFNLHNQLNTPYDDTFNERIHVFTLGDKISVSPEKRSFNGPNYGYKSLTDFLV